MAEVRWLHTAREDLRELQRYIAQDSPQRARAMVERIRSTVERLKDFPESGRVVPEYPGGPLREVIVPPYRVVYRYHPEMNAVRVLAVTHSSQTMPEFDEQD